MQSEGGSSALILLLCLL